MIGVVVELLLSCAPPAAEPAAAADVDAVACDVAAPIVGVDIVIIVAPFVIAGVLPDCCCWNRMLPMDAAMPAVFDRRDVNPCCGADVTTDDGEAAELAAATVAPDAVDEEVTDETPLVCEVPVLKCPLVVDGVPDESLVVVVDDEDVDVGVSAADSPICTSDDSEFRSCGGIRMDERVTDGVK